MPQLFVDTAFWVALMDPDDDWYERARVLDRRHNGDLKVTTHEVLIEVMNYFGDCGQEMRAYVVSNRSGGGDDSPRHLIR